MPELIKLTIVNAMSAICPHCGGSVTCGEDRSTGFGVLSHTLPQCDVFDRLEPTEFIESMVKAAKDG